jgi:hypothetical protein
MPIRDHNLDSIGELYATFKVKQTAGVDDLNDSHIGKAVTLTASNECGPGADGAQLLGKLIDLTLEDKDTGNRVATVQIGGVCRLPVTTTVPVIGNRVLCGANATIKQAPALAANDPAGGNIARGTVLAVNGTTDCVILLN